MTLIQLRYLIAIADAGLNITLAASRVHSSQPGMSKQMKQLEDELGFLLFGRRGRALVQLTPAGEAVLAHARRAVAEADNIRRYAANRRGDVEGSFVLASSQTQARYVLPPAIAQLSARYPKLNIELHPVEDAEVSAMIERGGADVALISNRGDAPASGLGVPLYRWRRKVLLPRTHPSAARDRLTMQELSELPLVSYPSSHHPDSSLRQAFRHAGLVPQIALTSRDSDSLKAYVEAGVGAGLIAEMALSSRDHLQFCALEAPEELAEFVTWAVLPRERVLRDYTIDLLRDLAPQLDLRDLRRILTGDVEGQWPEPPTWTALTQPHAL